MPIRFSVLTWNVENLFSPAPGAEAGIAERFRHKIALLRATVAAIDADVVALQEIGGDRPVAELQQALEGRYPDRRVSTLPDGRGIGVAFLSKLAIAEHEELADFPPGPALDIHDLDGDGRPVPVTRMGRGALRIRVSKEGFTVDVLNTHLKSKLLSYRRPGGRTSFAPRDESQRAQVAGIALMRRAAEAITLRDRANQLLEGNATTPLIVLGDLNDVPEAATSQILTGPPGSEPGTSGFDRADLGDDARLFNLAPLIDPEQRFSRVHRGIGELLDQILASEELFPRRADGRRSVPEVRSHTEFAGGLASVTENPNLRRDDIAPDHAPVSAAFEL
jgi:endonuclease/exonuclease/phosphatase family metal-dependent hydrolase